MSEPLGTIYLYHFSKRYSHAGHYLGWSSDPNAREAFHRNGRGANLLKVVAAAGIDYWLVRTWENVPRAEERRLKRRGGLARYCPEPECKKNRHEQYLKARYGDGAGSQGSTGSLD